MQPRMRWVRRLRYCMFGLSLLVIAAVHMATASANGHAIDKPTCWARLSTLQHDASPAVLQRVNPRPSMVSQGPSSLLHGPVFAVSSLALSLFPQDSLHAFVHVFRC